jgi:hypothetical protein
MTERRPVVQTMILRHRFATGEEGVSERLIGQAHGVVNTRPAGNPWKRPNSSDRERSADTNRLARRPRATGGDADAFGHECLTEARP